jgi:hypothetical protein
MRTRRLTTILLIGSGLAATGCGGEDRGRNAERFEGGKADVAQVVDDLETASRQDKPDTICSKILSDELARRIEVQTRTTCEDRLRRQLVSAERRFDVESSRVDGERARVRVKDQRGNVTVLDMEKIDDRWRIVDLAAVAG